MPNSSNYKNLDFLFGLSVRQKLAILLCVAFLLRLYVVLNAVVIAQDSITFIEVAKLFSEGNFSDLFHKLRPPLYPAAIALFSHITGDFVIAARVVSLVAGTMVVLVSFYLGRLIFNERVGLLTAFFVTIHPYLIRYSGDALCESLYHLLAALVTFFGLKALKRKKYLDIILTSFFGLLAYLTKTGAIGFLIVISILMVIYQIKDIRKDWFKRLKLIICCWMFFIVLALPYLIFMYHEYGVVTFTAWSIGTSFYSALPETHLLINKTYMFASHLPEAFTYPFFVIFLLYIYKCFKHGLSSLEYCLIAILVAYCLMYIDILPRRRYLIQLMPIALVLPAMGFYYIEKELHDRYKNKAPAIIMIILLIIMAVQLPKGMVSLRAHRLPEKLAGNWLLKVKGPGTKIMSRKSITVFYAKGRHTRLAGSNVENIISNAQTSNAEYIALYPARVSRTIPDFTKDSERLMQKVISFKNKQGNEFVIYSFQKD
jgi:4-amino-4-deoxy-L-arabinose transferase-like glycosyltransferase